jgi:DNA-binding helix-hairpin-helix protein with protein kinase domain
LLYDPQGKLVGYVMVHVQNAVKLVEVFNPRLRAKTLPNFDRRYLHRTARNLAAALGALHASEYVVGDLNESNIMVTPSALVTLIDADSFQVLRREGAKPILHPCPVGKPEYTPPELQGKRFEQTARLPEHDRFGLAVLIFQLLMDGNHPFRARWLGQGDPPPVEERIRNGHWPYHTWRSIPIEPPPNAPRLDSLHPDLAALFRQAFVDGHTEPRRRPAPPEWEAAIRTAEDALVPCGHGHFHPGHLKQCPDCQAEAVARARAQAMRQGGARARPAGGPRSRAPGTHPRRPPPPPRAGGTPRPPGGAGGSRPWPQFPFPFPFPGANAPAVLRCGVCGQVNAPDEIYCQKCEARLAGSRACPQCRQRNPSKARFCRRCGRPM